MDSKKYNDIGNWTLAKIKEELEFYENVVKKLKLQKTRLEDKYYDGGHYIVWDRVLSNEEIFDYYHKKHMVGKYND